MATMVRHLWVVMILNMAPMESILITREVIGPILKKQSFVTGQQLHLIFMQ